jgi:glyoxylase-like metal-dependent hydrolase (beta-lactamase superfamily II)
VIPYVREMSFDYGAADQVSPLIRRVVANNPGPFTYLGTGTYIVGKGEVAVIDPGPDLPAHLDAILRAVEGERVAAILVTHNHADHSPLADPLAAITGAPTYGCPLKAKPTPAEVRMEADHDLGFVAQNTVCGGGQIAGSGWTFEAIPTPGHTSNHICYALKEENCLFSGDHIMGWSTTVVTPPDGDMGQYLASLRLIAARGFSTIWPTHGPPIREVAPFLAAYEAHRLDRERQVLEQLAKGPARVGEMVPVVYAAVDSRLYPAAAQSMLAHLIQLEREGRVVADGAPALGAVFKLPPLAGESGA